jgi:hypothetical protein
MNQIAGNPTHPSVWYLPGNHPNINGPKYKSLDGEGGEALARWRGGVRQPAVTEQRAHSPELDGLVMFSVCNSDGWYR